METHEFQDRHVLVTGGAGGIGSACARHFLERGAKVTLVDVDAQRLQQTRIGSMPFRVERNSTTCHCL